MMRFLYFAAIVNYAIKTKWSEVFFHGIIFVGTAFLPYLGKKNEDYYILDTMVMLTMLLSIFTTAIGWSNPAPLVEKLFTLDKLFHIAGGAMLAMFIAIIIRKRVNDKLVFYTGIIIFALAMGAAWELFEWVMTILPPPFTSGSTGYDDSMLDLIADTVGASILALILYIRHYL